MKFSQQVKRFNFSSLHALFLLIAMAILAGCASIGRPGGGPRDETPPTYIRSNPEQGALNVQRNRIEIFFDENIQLEDAFNKVVVSPAQKLSPVVRSQGKRVTVELRDTLVPNATYTIDFGDAIKDLNEGNILDGFAFDFSTGDKIDSMRISGVLLEGRTLEPAQGVLVGVYSNLADSALSTLPLERVARTNSRGQFTIRGLKDTQYKVVAINDINRDNKWDRSEDVAFFDLPVVPSVKAITVNDTLRDSSGKDSIVTRPGVAYLPADILLTWFNENYTPHYLKEFSRPIREKVSVILSAPTDSLVSAKIVNTPALQGVDWNEITIADFNPTNDSISWWIKDPQAVKTDSLSLALTYPAMDSTENVYMKTDTLRFFYRPSSAELKKAKELEKLREKGADTIPEPQIFMELRQTSGNFHDVYNPIKFESSTPWGTIDNSKIRFSIAVDSLWEEIPFDGLQTVPGASILKRQLIFTPKPGEKYRFEADSAAIKDIYGHPIKKFTHEFTVRSLDSYSNVIFNISPADSTAVVELLNGNDAVVRAAKTDARGHVEFKYLDPGTYYARMFYDDNHDGKWTTGNVSQQLQPEEVAYYPKKIDARANWDVDLTWDIYQTPIDTQKPYAILKNKPKLKKGETAPTDDEETEVDEWGHPINRNDRTRNNSLGNGSNNSMQQIRNAGGLLRR